ncbi:MAG: hypothetical protein WA996_22175 [Candidatus Promineifilaceae bacterium]
MTLQVSISPDEQYVDMHRTFCVAHRFSTFPYLTWLLFSGLCCPIGVKVLVSQDFFSPLQPTTYRYRSSERLIRLESIEAEITRKDDTKERTINTPMMMAKTIIWFHSLMLDNATLTDGCTIRARQ